MRTPGREDEQRGQSIKDHKKGIDRLVKAIPVKALPGQDEACKLEEQEKGCIPQYGWERRPAEQIGDDDRQRGYDTIHGKTKNIMKSIKAKIFPGISARASPGAASWRSYRKIRCS